MKTKISWENQLSRRERLPEPPSYSAVRAVLRVMEEKGVLTHECDGPRYVYKTTMPQKQGRDSILKRVLETLFNGSREQLVAALLDSGETKIDREELDRLMGMIEAARKQK